MTAFNICFVSLWLIAKEYYPAPPRNPSSNMLCLDPRTHHKTEQLLEFDSSSIVIARDRKPSSLSTSRRVPAAADAAIKCYNPLKGFEGRTSQSLVATPRFDRIASNCLASLDDSRPITGSLPQRPNPAHTRCSPREKTSRYWLVSVVKPVDPNTLLAMVGEIIHRGGRHFL